MTTPIYSMTPDMTPMARLVAVQTKMAMQTSELMMRMAYMPWKSWSVSFGSLNLAAAQDTKAEALPAVAPVTEAKDEEVTAEVVETVAAPVEETPVVAEAVAEPVVETVEAPAEIEAEPVEAESTEPDAAALLSKPEGLDAPRGEADDLTQIKGVGPKVANNLKDAGFYHFDQIAAWTEAEVAWIDENIAGVRGRASRQGWVAQAKEMAS